MVGTATSLALLSTAGVVAIFTKLPKSVQKFMVDHALLTDFVSLIVVYVVLGGTLTALFASAIAGLLISGALHVLNHKEEFAFVFDLADAVGYGLKRAQEALTDFSAQYSMKKEKVVN